MGSYCNYLYLTAIILQIMKNIIGIIIAVAVVIGLVHFLSPKDSQQTATQSSELDDSSRKLEGTSWTFGEGGELSFMDGRYSATAGCNTISGAFTETDNAISFEAGMSTLMFCEDLDQAENDLKEVLSQAMEYRIDGDTLMIMGEDVSLELSPMNDSTTEMNNETIVEKYWKLIVLEGQEVTMSDNQEKEISFTLKSDGSVQGFAGCNTMMGSYTLEDGDRISFSQMATTRMACPDLAVNEADYLEVFNLADNYTLVGDTLSLNIGRRAPLAVFEAVYLN